MESSAGNLACGTDQAFECRIECLLSKHIALKKHPYNFQTDLASLYIYRWVGRKLFCCSFVYLLLGGGEGGGYDF